MTCCASASTLAFWLKHVSRHSTVNCGCSCGIGTFQGTSVQSYPFIVTKWCDQAVERLQMQNANVMTDQRLTFSTQGNDINSCACFPSFPRFCGFFCNSLHSWSSHFCSSLLVTEEEKVRCLTITSQKKIQIIFFLSAACSKRCTFFYSSKVWSFIIHDLFLQKLICFCNCRHYFPCVIPGWVNNRLTQLFYFSNAICFFHVLFNSTAAPNCFLDPSIFPGRVSETRRMEF